MSETIKNLIDTGLLPNAMSLTGSAGFTNVVSVINVADVPYFCDLVGPEEVMLIANNFEHILTPQGIRKLSRRGCSGIISKKRFERMFSPEIISLCEDLRIPILLLDDTNPWSTLISGFFRYTINRQYQATEEALSIQQRFLTTALDVDESQNICNVAADMIAVPIALVDYECKLILASKGYEWDMALKGLSLEVAIRRNPILAGMDDVKLDGYLHFNQFLNDSSSKLLVIPIEQGRTLYGYTVAAVKDNLNSLPLIDIVKLQQFSTIAALEIIKRNEVVNTNRRYYNLLLDELLDSQTSDNERLLHKYGLRQKQISPYYEVCVVGYELFHGNVRERKETLSTHRFQSIYRKIKEVTSENGNALLFENKDNFVILNPYSDTIVNPKRTNQLLRVLLEHLGRQYNGMGVSNIVELKDIRRGYFQAVKALSISKQMRRKEACRYSDLGVLRIFFDRQGTIDLAACCEIFTEYLEPLLQYDANHHTKLFQTVEMYSNMNFRAADTCEKLFIHKNTLYARMSRITKVIGKNIGDGETLFNIQLSLKIKQFMDSHELMLTDRFKE